MAKRLIFAEKTPLGERVVLTRDRWREIVRFKHPAMAGREGDVRECVRDPDLICESAKDRDVHLHYRAIEQGHVCVVVGGEYPQARFVITAYTAKHVKKGPNLWTK